MKKLSGILFVLSILSSLASWFFPVPKRDASGLLTAVALFLVYAAIMAYYQAK